MQNLSPKDFAGGDILKLKVSWRIYPLWALKSYLKYPFCQLIVSTEIFFLLLMDGTTDKGIIYDKMFLALW